MLRQFCPLPHFSFAALSWDYVILMPFCMLGNPMHRTLIKVLAAN